MITWWKCLNDNCNAILPERFDKCSECGTSRFPRFPYLKEGDEVYHGDIVWCESSNMWAVVGCSMNWHVRKGEVFVRGDLLGNHNIIKVLKEHQTPPILPQQFS